MHDPMKRSTTKTIGRDLPNSDHLEITATLRQNHPTLSDGFAITGELWEHQKNSTGRSRKQHGREADVSGCIHDEILTAAPELAPLVKVHLASPDGLPMHAKANGWYEYSGAAAAFEREQSASGLSVSSSHKRMSSNHERAARILGISPQELPHGLDRVAFEAFVDSLMQHYQDETDRARAVLHALVDLDGIEAAAMSSR